jgi:microcystin-dependent protein
MPARSFKRVVVAGALLGAGATVSLPANADVDPFIGEIMWVAFEFCPKGWAHTNGQLLPIAQNTALFSLLGTQYGGDGRVTFALPDLRGRQMVHVGTGPGLSPVDQGQTGGSEISTLTFAQLPAHAHTATTTVDGAQVTSTLYGSAASGNSTSPAGAALATTRKSTPTYVAGSPDQAMASASVRSTVTGGTATTTINASGGGQPFSVRDPYLGLRACIALTGVFPPRN